jgi:glycerol-3-phosphate O-acyltransferase/dihydroxyacetone phosphate acyltransferase
LGNRIAEPAVGQAKELLVTQRIGETVAHVYRTQPERAAVFAAKLDFYERWLRRLKISDEALELFPQRKKLAARALWWAAIAVIGAPMALYGWVHRLIPYALVKWSARKFTMPGRRKAQASTTAIAAGVVGFGVCYAIYIGVFQWLFGWPASLWYALSLPVTGLLAHYYLREIKKLWTSVRTAMVLVRAPFAAQEMLARRAGLIKEIERVWSEIKTAREQS